MENKERASKKWKEILNLKQVLRCSKTSLPSLQYSKTSALFALHLSTETIPAPDAFEQKQQWDQIYFSSRRDNMRFVYR